MNEIQSSQLLGDGCGEMLYAVLNFSFISKFFKWGLIFHHTWLQMLVEEADISFSFETYNLYMFSFS